jgi:hypothetical protein
VAESSRVRTAQMLPAGERLEDREMARTRLVEPRQKRVRDLQSALGRHEEGRPAFARAHRTGAVGRRLERPHDRRPDGDDEAPRPPRLLDRVRRLRGHAIELLRRHLALLKARDARVQEHPRYADAFRLESLEDARGEGARGGGHLGAPEFVREDGLVVLKRPLALHVRVADRHAVLEDILSPRACELELCDPEPVAASGGSRRARGHVWPGDGCPSSSG